MKLTGKLSEHITKVLYHHRTQGKAVEGVHIRGITDALRADGVQVDVISLPGADPYASPKAMSPTQQANSLLKVVARLPEPFFELAELAYNAVAAWKVWRNLAKSGRVDFIYERYSLFLFGVVALARLKNIPIILEVNDSATVERVRPVYFLKLAKWVEGWVFRRASGLVFVSSVFRDRIQQAHGQIAPAIITPNAANIDKFSYTPAQRAAARERWQLDGKVVCGYLGAFVPWHAIDQFVFKMADHLSARPDLVLLLVGDGATHPEVDAFVRQRGLQSQVILTGRVSHDEVPGLLAAMDMAILPSAGDYTSPVKLFEFMACGIAPIAPDFLPIREVLRVGETGWTFPANQLDIAVKMVLDKSVDLPALQQVGQAARTYIANERQWRHNVVQLVEFMFKVSGR
jgi:glycosyltransferase involved in cell wall biosynthesis